MILLSLCEKPFLEDLVYLLVKAGLIDRVGVLKRMTIDTEYCLRVVQSQPFRSIKIRKCLFLTLVAGSV